MCSVFANALLEWKVLEDREVVSVRFLMLPRLNPGVAH